MIKRDSERRAADAALYILDYCRSHKCIKCPFYMRNDFLYDGEKPWCQIGTPHVAWNPFIWDFKNEDDKK